MHTTHCIIASAATIALSGSAVHATEASFHFCFDPDTFTLSGGQSVSITFDNLQGTLSGFMIEFGFDNSASPGSWASDAAFVLPGGQAWGGFSGLFGPSAGAWSFAGSGSGFPGDYSDSKSVSVDGVSPIVFTNGTSYTFVFGNDYEFSDPVTYSDVCITLFGVVPSPGALALLGMAGLTSRRRRH